MNVTINTTSVDTNHAERDKHLRSADFLNTAKYPQATFTSTSVKKDGDDTDITGDLTLNGVTKPVTLEAKLIGQGDDPWGGKRAGFEAEGKIKLKDFNIKTDLGPASGSGSDYFSGRRTAEVRGMLPDGTHPAMIFIPLDQECPVLYSNAHETY